MPSPVPLPRSTDRIELRRFTSADLPAFQAYRGDSELGRYQGWEPMSDSEAATFLGEVAEAELFVPGRWSQVAMADPATHALVGDIGLHLSEDGGEVEIGFTLQASHQGRGLATEALAEAIRMIWAHTDAVRIKGVTDARNRPSIATMERLGMAREAVVETTFRGEPCTEYVYVLGRNRYPLVITGDVP